MDLLPTKASTAIPSLSVMLARQSQAILSTVLHAPLEPTLRAITTSLTRLMITGLRALTNTSTTKT